MARSDLDLGALNDAFSSAQISKHEEPTGPSYTNDDGDAGGLQVTCFSEVVNETAFHLQIIRLPKQVRLPSTSLHLFVQFNAELNCPSQNLGNKISLFFYFFSFCLEKCRVNFEQIMNSVKISH